MTKRLFIFAAYDKDNIVDQTLIYYLNALSKFGDIVFTMDNDAPVSELAKIQNIPNVLHASAVRHGEYDFGSYKRGYIWAQDNKLLSKYDWIYLVNDSVIGPLFDLSKCITEMELQSADMIGMVGYSGTELLPHIQSWFVGLRQDIATSQFFKEFLFSVKHQDSKELVVFAYEVRMTQLVLQHGYKYYAYSNASSDIYCKPIKCIACGIPFIKKLALPKILKTYNIYSCCDKNMLDNILNYATRTGLTHDDTIQQKDLNQYHKVLRLTLFSVPIISIYGQQPRYGNSAYKIKLFDFIPVLKIALCNKHT